MSNGLGRDKLIVNGYIHRQKTNIPLEIMKLCLKWYHIPLFWEFIEDSRVEPMNDETKPTIIKYKSGREFTSCYASVIMPSMNNDVIYEYNIKADGCLIAVGISNAKFLNAKTFFYDNGKNKSEFYALLGWDGRIVSYKSWSENSNYADGLRGRTEMNEIKLIYDPSNATLSYKINGKDYGIACYTSKSSETSYRLAIHVDSRNDMIIELK